MNDEIRISNTIVTLKKGEGRTLKSGGLWVFSNEIDTITGTFKNGDVVTVHDFDGYPMGKGYINQNSKIRVRLLSRKADTEINRDFLKMRVQAAWDYRKAVMHCADDLNCCRVIFGEADFLPGLTVDKYADTLVMECLALGMEQFKTIIAELLVEVMAADGFDIRLVYERSDARERDKEGLARFKGVVWSSDEDLANRIGMNDFNLTVEEGKRVIPEIEIVENGVHYIIDVVSGQKTGFFLDQKYNRQAMQNICRSTGKNEQEKSLRVLDCFTHMGTFALNCGLAGATDVTGLDISEYAVQQATANAVRNGLDDRVKFRCANVLEELPRLAAAGEKFDVVILDPPAFTKSREATKNAIKGYREINMKGLKLVKDGGYFATCSCSHFMTQELLAKTVKEAAKATHKRLRQIEFRTQGPDHPILWANSANVPESYYLKFFIFQVVEEK